MTILHPNPGAVGHAALLGPQLTPHDIATIVLDAGIPVLHDTWQGAIATAIALAETGGHPWTVNTNHLEHRADGTPNPAWLSQDHGLWAINDYWHPDIPIREANQPAVAIHHVHAIALEGATHPDWALNWTWWATYAPADPTGPYRATHLPTAVRAWREIRAARGLPYI